MIEGLEPLLIWEDIYLLVSEGQVYNFVDVFVIGSQFLRSSSQSYGRTHAPHHSLLLLSFCRVEGFDIGFFHEFLEILYLLPESSLIFLRVHDLIQFELLLEGCPVMNV